jgi:hypothetical protein
MAISTLEVSAHSVNSMEQAEPPKPESFIEAARLQEAVKEELAAILASSSFSSSRKSCEFLRYIVQVALDGRVDSLKERSIGLDLLGRDTSYDPSSDATVRVRANDVRKRLKHFYLTHTPKSGYRIELLPGSYSPRFVYVTAHTEISPPDLSAHGQKASSGSQSVIPPVSLIDIMRPTFIALLISALFLRQQIMKDDPYHQFWNARLQGKSAMIVAEEVSNLPLASNENLRAILPIIWLAGRYDLKPVMNEHTPQNEPRLDETQRNAVTIHSSLATPHQLAHDKRLRYLITESHGSLYLIDRSHQSHATSTDEQAALLTVLPEYPATLWIAGTDVDSINRLAELITNKDSFPASLNKDVMAGQVVQAVLRDSSSHLDLYTY